MKYTIVLFFLISALILPACTPSINDPTVTPSTTEQPVEPTPMDDKRVSIAADTALFDGVSNDPFAKEVYTSSSAPRSRLIKLESVTYSLEYQDSCRGERIDGDLDRYVTKGGELSVWYRAESDEIVSVEFATGHDFARDAEAVLYVKSANLLRSLCDFDLNAMVRTYTYIPKVEAQHERLATVRYEIPREDGRSYQYAIVDYHSNMISIEIYRTPEPPDDVLDELEQASNRLSDYLIHTRADKTPIVTDVTSDALPDVYYKDGRWVLETTRTVTYLIGKNEMTRQVDFYLWLNAA